MRAIEFGPVVFACAGSELAKAASGLIVYRRD
jgi:hypothetical protein